MYTWQESWSEHGENDIGTLSNDRRDELRSGVPERWHIRIVNSDLSAEICITHNVSRCGLYFVTSSTYYTPGMRLCVIRNFDPDLCMAAEEMGEIPRVYPLQDNKVGVAMRILKDEKLVPA